MAYIKVRENESLDSAIKRFKRSCTKEGIIGDIKRKDQYEKPSVARKKKAENARKRKNSRD
ncbi:MAG: 30S ribosomal protein S21 [Clostridia bacterium]|nr:30S ribosomal protein S21 [Clostridia bacterium]